MKLIYRVRVPIHTYIGTSGAREREEEWNCVRQWCPPPRVESNWIHNLLITIDKSMWFHELFNTATRLNFIVSFNFPMTYRSWRPWQKTLSINKFIIAVAESYWMAGWVIYIYHSNCMQFDIKPENGHVFPLHSSEWVDLFFVTRAQLPSFLL